MNKNTYLGGYRPVGNYAAQAKIALMARTRAFNRMLELLHLQIIRKGRFVKYSEHFYHPKFGAIYAILIYDIKSPSKAPYDRDNRDNLGLNQFFMGQSPYKWYDGNPKKGIYHDKVDIVGGNLKKNTQNFRNIFSNEEWEYRLSDNTPILFIHPTFECVGLVYAIARTITFSEFFDKESASGKSRKEPTAAVITFDVYRQINEIENGKYKFEKIREDTKALKILPEDEELSADFFLIVHDRGGAHIKMSLFETIILDGNTTYKISPKKAEDIGLSYIDKNSGKSRAAYKVGFHFDGGNYKGVLLHDGRLLYRTATSSLIYETFFVNDNRPVRGVMNFIVEWATNHNLNVYEDKGIPKIANVGAMIVAMVGAYFAGPWVAGLYANSILGGLVAFTTMLSLSVTIMGLATQDADAISFSKKVGLVGSIIGVTAIGQQLVQQIGQTAASSASNLSANSVAELNALSQTSAAYAQTGAANASAVGANFTSSSMIGFSGNSGSAVTPAINTAGMISFSSAAQISTSEILKTAAQFLLQAYSTYSNTREIFKKPQKYQDDEMPDNEDKKTPGVMLDAKYRGKSYLDDDDEYDLGLTEGTLFYLEPPKFKR